MAIITKNNVSGNWNATTSWVGGVVPTSVDDVVFDATSAGVIQNVAATIKSLDMTGFVNTFTFSSTLEINGTTNSAGLGYATNSTCILDGNSAYSQALSPFVGLRPRTCNILHLGTASRWGITWQANGTNYLSSDLYLKWITQTCCGAKNTFTNGYKIYVEGNIYYGNQDTRWRNAERLTNYKNNIILDGNTDQFIVGENYSWGITMRKTGGRLYSKNNDGSVNSSMVTYYRFRNLSTDDYGYGSFAGTMSFIHESGDFGDSFALNWLGAPSTNFTGWKGIEIESDVPIPELIVFFANLSYDTGNRWVDIDTRAKRLLVNRFTFIGNNGNFFNFYNPATTQIETQGIRFIGSGGLSASYFNFNTGGALLNFNATSSLPSWTSLNATVIFDSDGTYDIGTFSATQQVPFITNTTNAKKMTIQSMTASSVATINIANRGTSYDFNWKDISVTGQTLYAIGGTTLTNTTGITSSFGGGGGGGSTETSHTFIL